MFYRLEIIFYITVLVYTKYLYFIELLYFYVYGNIDLQKCSGFLK